MPYSTPPRPPYAKADTVKWVFLLWFCAVVHDCYAQALLHIPDERFLAAYFSGEEPRGLPTVVREEATLDFQWQDAAPDPAVPADVFSARYLGRFAFESATYVFHLEAAGGVVLLIDGEEVLDTWLQPQTATTLSRSLADGAAVIELRFRHQTGPASLRLVWYQQNLSAACEPQPNRFCVALHNATDLADAPFREFRSNRIESAPEMAGSAAITWRGNMGFTAGRYAFSGHFKGALELHLAGELIFSADGTGDLQSFSVAAPTNAGLLPLEVYYFPGEGAPDINIEWLAVNEAFATASVGINIHQLTYWSPEWTLLDAFKASGGWFTQTDLSFDTGEQDRLDLDAQGFVKSLPDTNSDASFTYVAALLLNGNGGKHPPGRYVVTYEGEGTIEYFFDAVKVEKFSRPGRHVLRIDNPTNGGILLRITETDPRGVGNHLRNIRVFLPGYRCANDPFTWATEAADCAGGESSAQAFEAVADAQPFHPAFLQNIRQYKAIRYMDFLATNGNTVDSWANRTLRNDGRYTFNKGAPPELAIDIARFLGSDAWINLPHQATDEYVREIAQYALSNLAPHQRVVVEYSNEVWNLIFSQGSWVQEQGEARWPNEPSDGYFKRINWYGMRANEVIGIWKAVWDHQADRVIGAMGGQLSNETIAQVALDCPLWAAENGGQNCTSNIDVLTMAPYFGGYLGNQEYYDQVKTWLTQGQAFALDQLFADITQGGLLPGGQAGLAQAIGWMQQARATADAFGLELMAYEGGQHLVGVGTLINDEELTALFNAANRDERMFAVYQDYLAAWRGSGGALFCLWMSMSSFDRFGNWGIQESMDDLDNPKYRAVQAFLESTPCWWQGCTSQQL